MKRLTTQSANKMFYVTESITGRLENEGYYGEAINRLAQFENLYDHLMARRESIPTELEALRRAGKEKTVTFKELLMEKMMNEMILMQLERHGIEQREQSRVGH